MRLALGLTSSFTCGSVSKPRQPSPGAAVFVAGRPEPGCAAPGRATGPPGEPSLRALRGNPHLSTDTPQARLLLWRSDASSSTSASHTSANEALRTPGGARLGWAEGGSAYGSLKQRGSWAEPACRGNPARHRRALAGSGRQGARPRPFPRALPPRAAPGPASRPGPAFPFPGGHVIRAPRPEAASSRPATNGRLACGGLRGERSGGAAGRWRRRRLPGGGRGLREGMARRAARSG